TGIYFCILCERKNYTSTIFFTITLENKIYKENAHMDLNIENKVKGVKNNFLNHTYNKDDLSNFSSNNIKQVLKFQKTNKRYLKTPLTSLKALSQYLGVKNIFVKDESQRFELNAFKVMGGIYAIGKYIAKKLGKDIEEITF